MHQAPQEHAIVQPLAGRGIIYEPNTISSFGNIGIKSAVMFYQYFITSISSVSVLPKDDLEGPGKSSLPYRGVQQESSRLLQDLTQQLTRRLWEMSRPFKGQRELQSMEGSWYVHISYFKLS